MMVRVKTLINAKTKKLNTKHCLCLKYDIQTWSAQFTYQEKTAEKVTKNWKTFIINTKNCQCQNCP